MTNIEHAAVFLRVPMSGTDWLDAMIIEARRWDAAQAALEGLLMQPAEEDVGLDRFAAASIECANAFTRQMKESISRNSPISPKT